jgi:hypothetical protein
LKAFLLMAPLKYVCRNLFIWVDKSKWNSSQLKVKNSWHHLFTRSHMKPRSLRSSQILR